jgi:hypothetical protein
MSPPASTLRDAFAAALRNHHDTLVELLKAADGVAADDTLTLYLLLAVQSNASTQREFHTACQVPADATR